MNDSVGIARSARRRGVVLKVRLSELRSRKSGVPVIVVEGAEDVGPFESWISRECGAVDFEAMAATGKAQLLEFVEILRRDATGLGERTIALIDRDFDGMRGIANGADVYCIPAYSVENYLVGPEVVASIVRDEFRCVVDGSDVDAIVRLYSDVMEQFIRACREENCRLFAAVKCGVSSKILSDRASDIADIDLTSAARRKSGDGSGVVACLVEVRDFPSGVVPAGSDVGFESLNPRKDYRGKYLLSFLMTWLALLAQERRVPVRGLFKTPMDVRYSETKFPLRLLASRSEVPPGLGDALKVRMGWV